MPMVLTHSKIHLQSVISNHFDTSFELEATLGDGGEIQLTDAIEALMESETVEAFHMSGRSHDCGDKLGYLKAIVEYSLRHKTLGKELTEHVKGLVN